MINDKLKYKFYDTLSASSWASSAAMLANLRKISLSFLEIIILPDTPELKLGVLP